MCACLRLFVKPNRAKHTQAQEKGREIIAIDFLTFSVGEKVGWDLLCGEKKKARDNAVKKQ